MADPIYRAPAPMIDEQYEEIAGEPMPVQAAESVASTMPTSERCPLGSLSAHTYNYERDECIWCGPNGLAWKPGRWVSNGDGTSAWSVRTPPGEAGS